MSGSTIAIILGILIFALLLWACSRNAIVVGERQEREFRRWKEQQEREHEARTRLPDDDP